MAGEGEHELELRALVRQSPNRFATVTVGELLDNASIPATRRARAADVWLKEMATRASGAGPHQVPLAT
jgi:hypothetical protein